ncbi:MAG: branched-chain amino acid ABC transporter ATP-binding protein/permease [Burkholderiaceae bacterium]
MSIPHTASAHRQALLRRAAMAAIGALALAALAGDLVSGDYARFLAGSVAFTAITILSISILAGVCGIWSLGHTAFIAIGAYTSANLATAGWPLEAILPVVAIAAAAVGYLLGVSAGRFSILYFGLLTLAVALSTGEVVGRFSDLTGGDNGLMVPPMKSLLLQRELLPADGPAVAVVLSTLVFILSDWVVTGTIGERWRAVKSQRIAASAIGLVPHRANANAFAFSAAIAAVGGVATALVVGFLDPIVFDLRSAIMLIVGSVVGGIGSFLGAVVGATFIVGVPEAGRAFKDVSAFALGAAMVLVLLVLPRGVAPTLADFVQYGWRRARAPRATTGGSAAAQTVTQLTRRLMPACREPLRIENLSVAFGGLSVLQRVSLTVAPGETVGLIGPNGAGKTTLINVISGFVEHTGCDMLRFGDVDLLRASVHARLGHGIGRTFQHAELFDELTIREMLLVAACQRSAGAAVAGLPAPEEIADAILDALKLRAVADALPEELPFGIRKVADIGRTLAAGARFVALDEPFSGLDAGEIAELRDILRSMKAAGVSILLIDHAVQEVLDITDRVVVLNFGTVLASGTPRDISDNADVQQAYFGRKAVRPDEAVHG